ncbi:SdiA-regulated domain-containing protein [Algoriphagus taiwanensis]|uniref:SdiA-regulated domain-containing protein n=1 Tax=Algoriphagus taiwanensis TaxID=1445656 RepID=UPI0030C72660
MPKKLREISGIAWHRDEILAIEDENGIIYRIDPKSGEILSEQKFGKPGDYEDILIFEDKAWVLRSDGAIFQVENLTGKVGEGNQFSFERKGQRDFETLLAIPNQNQLFLICKTCSWDKKQEASIFRFDIMSGKLSEDFIGKISTKKEDLPKENEIKRNLEAQPSSAAIHPITEEIFMISSSGKWLMVLDQEFHPKEIYELDPRLFNQPEGITFDPKGNLYISNEGGKGKPNLLFFPYQGDS